MSSPVALFRRTFYALDSPQYRTLWFGTLFSFLGMQMQVIARGYLAYDLTGKNSALGGVMLAFGLPQLLLTLWGGVVADRLPKRNVLIVAQLIIAANSAWLAVMIAIGAVEYWMLIVAGVVQGAGFAFVGPARQAFTADLVGHEALGNAVVLQQLNMNSTRVIGPSMAGAFIAIPFIGVAGVYFMTTIGFLFATATMLRLPPGNPRVRTVQRSPLLDMRDGVGYVMGRPAILMLILSSFSLVMIGFPYQSFLPAIAKDVYGVDSTGLGLLSTFGAIGAVAATLCVAVVAGGPRAFAWQSLTGLGFGVALVAMGGVSVFWAGLLAMVAVGALASAFQSLNNSLIMTYTDRDYTGRVQSITMMSWSLFGVAALPIGILADHIGIRETLVLTGIVCVGLVIIIQTLSHLIHAETDRVLPHQVPAPASGGR